MNSNNPSRSKKSRKPADTFANTDFAESNVPVLVGLTTFVVFLPALWNEFVNWDDYETLSWLTFAVDTLIWGTNPLGYHLTNLVLHVSNAVLFFFLARLLLFHAVGRSNDESQIGLRFSAALAALFFS